MSKPSHVAAPPVRLVRAPEREPAVVESYRRLADVFHDVLSEESLDALLERIADTVAELIPYDDLHIYKADEAARTLHAVFVRGEWADEVLSDEPIAFGEGITGWAVQHREAVLSNKAHLDPRVRFVANTPIEPEALIAVPLIARGRVKGTLNIYRVGEQAAFTEDELQLASRFGDAAALALDNAHIRARLVEQARTDPLTGLLNHRAFHELLREALLEASATHGTVSLVMLDLDDFKRVNDVYGHAVGDAVLAKAAELLRASVRGSDAVCRIGGEEFAVVVPGGDLDVAVGLAERLSAQVLSYRFETAGNLSVSVGVAVGPAHAANPRELVACAEVAMMTAKARGKNRVVVFDEDGAERPEHRARHEDTRSIAHLKMLQSVTAKLSRLTEVTEIAATVADELRRLIDYHNCRVFLRHGDDLRPVAFRGDLTSVQSRVELLETKVGIGITGRVAETGVPLLVGDAANCEFGHHIEGTPAIEESLLAVPLLYGADVVGVLVVSKLGLDQFDAADLRLLEVLAGHASVALVNARLLEAQRREAEGAKALLGLARALASITELDDVLDRIASEAARMLGSDHVSVWLPVEGSDEVQCRGYFSSDAERRAVVLGTTLPARAVAGYELLERPFLVAPPDYAHVLPEVKVPVRDSFYGVAPLALECGAGAIAVAADNRPPFDERELELLGGIASQARLAITNALNFNTLERTFLATVEALANALEAKDEYTSSHARWITDLALRVGSRFGVDQQALKRLELAALFHDIGKIGMPASILTKPGPLSDDERRLIETHPEIAERILAPIEQLADVRPIVRACHERWDGTGYPDGLAGDEIPLEARIIFACDAFHAMTTDRPYREALPVAEACRRLREAAGTQLDPDVVEVCLQVLHDPREDEQPADAGSASNE